MATGSAQRYRRHPGDVLRLSVGLAVTAATAAVAATRRVGPLEGNLFRVLNDLPAVAAPPMRLLMWLATLRTLPVLAAVALVARRRLRPAVDLVLAGLSASALGEALRIAVARGRPDTLLPAAQVRVPADTVLAFPSGHTTIAAALATVISPFLPRPARRGVWALVALIGVGRIYLGAHLPVDVLGGAALGWAIGAALDLTLGAPGGEADPVLVRRWLTERDLPSRELLPAGGDARSSFPFFARDGDHELFVKVVSREQRDADVLWKLKRRLVYREVEDEAPFATPKQQVELEAYLTLVAERAGASTPTLVTTGVRDDGAGILVQQRVRDARGLDALANEDVDDELLRDLWQQVACLRRARLAHRDLKRANVLIDGKRRVWLVDFGFGEAGATDRRLARDVAELSASLAGLVGIERTVETAMHGLGPSPLAEALPFLYPAALTPPTRREVQQSKNLLPTLRAAIATAAGTEPPKRPQITRFSPRTLIGLAAGAFAVHVLLPQIAELGQIRDALGNARWGWVAIAAVASALRYVFAAVQQSGAVSTALPLIRSVVAQLAAAYGNRAAPGGIGGIAVRERFLESSGIDRPAAVASIGLVQTAGFLAHAVTLLVTAVVVGGSLPLLRPPPAWETAAGVGLGSVVIGLVAGPFRRRLLGPIRRGLSALGVVLRQPLRTAQLFGGSAGVLFGYAAALLACLHAFGADVGVGRALLVFLAGSAVASASPTPGGLGALEAALVAGLTATGAAAAPVVAAVLGYRILTFWLPILPGFLAFRALIRRDII